MGNLAIDQNAFNFLIDRQYPAKEIIANYIIKQEVQGLKAFTYSVITIITDEHKKPTIVFIIF